MFCEIFKKTGNLRRELKTIQNEPTEKFKNCILKLD